MIMSCMNSKNITIAFIVLCVLGLTGFFLVSSSADNQESEDVALPDDNSKVDQDGESIQKEYHNTEYGYTLSYAGNLTIVEDAYSANGVDGSGFGWFYVEATTTSQTIQEHIAQRNEMSEEDSYVVDDETTVSGYPAVITHIQNVSDPTVHGANSTLFVKKGDILFSFYVRGNEEDNATFIKSVRFD